MDYLSQVPPLVATLGVRSDSMHHNPLMLEHTLGARPPAASEDAAPEEDDGVRLEKERLRRAEAALVAEEAQATMASSQASLQGLKKALGGGQTSLASLDATSCNIALLISLFCRFSRVCAHTHTQAGG